MATETQAAGSAGVQTLEGGSLLDEILAETKMTPGDEGYDIAKRGVQAFISELVAPRREGEKVDKAFVDALIAEIDVKLSRQIDEILHNPSFQKLESAWRGLKFVIDRCDFRENVKVEMLNCSKEDLLADFEDAPEVPKSGLYKIVYSAEFGQFGGKPVGAIIANYEFGPGPQDIALLQKCAAVATMSHAPFIAAAGPQFFGLKDFQGLPNLKDLKALFEGPQYTKWNAFRETEDARYVGLVMPRFLLRLPFGANTVPVKAFNYEEDVVGKHDAYCWGNATYAFATRLADSFAKYRWCPNIIGPQAGGSVENLPLHQYEAMGEIQTKVPTEIMLTERREFELSEEGFIGLTFRKDSDNAAFFSANSAQKAKFFGQSDEGRAAEMNYRLGTQLPYMFIMCRIAHYLKVLQREQIGTWKERADLEKELNDWIGQYVADQDVVSAATRGRRPLRKAKIIVTEVPGNAGWYKVDMQVRPHFKYMGAFFTLSLVGKLDKE
ncbi:type VI secretion system contractile sheath large subunit [Sorangium atrum]|uniref:Type VI secretion system contractile sheath large subunit n=1 Tax=Sorangium atrum TaxID=2995308 RepID=A0ABT5BSI2_9BACT|nr:type VI secretion system contractile sheath large subunit [Sorangium aterium]MDC0677115.1 type VI secretion system contractile sheath large subunit [Sorangium aterium]